MIKHQTIELPTDNGERLDVHIYNCQLDKGVNILKAEGLEEITARDLADIRLTAGPDHYITKRGAFVAETIIYLHNGNILLTDRNRSPILKDATKAVELHRKHEEFYLDEKIVNELCECAEVDTEKAIKSGVILIPKKEIQKEIPVLRLDKKPLTRFLFRDLAGQYGHLLKEGGVDSLPLHALDAMYSTTVKAPFARALYVHLFWEWFYLGSNDPMDFKSSICADKWIEPNYWGVWGLKRMPTAKRKL
ncbi:MAG TPA: hypothetical protein HA362_06315 [Nanoarchaeota archaeon]|nr:hypothetical protein [Nanoarchaeota archaeon]